MLSRVIADLPPGLRQRDPAEDRQHQPAADDKEHGDEEPVEDVMLIEHHFTPPRKTLWKHHFLEERQDQENTTHQDERDHAPVEKPILLEGHFGP